jgi:hypothetical protein
LLLLIPGLIQPVPNHRSGFDFRAMVGREIGNHPRSIPLPQTNSDMQTPSTVQLRTAIQVLKMFGEHLNNQASNTAIELAESHQSSHYAERIEAGTIEQTTRIETVAAQLEKWRDKLVHERRQCVSNHI